MQFQFINSILNANAIYQFNWQMQMQFTDEIYIYSLLQNQAWTFRVVRGLYLQPKSTFYSIA